MIPRFGAIGTVVRRSCGSLVSATAHVLTHFTDPLLLEFLAICQVLYVAQYRYQKSFIIYSDSAEAIRLINSSILDTRVGQVLPKCEDLLHALPLVSLFHVSRLSNSVAYLVACMPLNYPNNDTLFSLTNVIPTTL